MLTSRSAAAVLSLGALVLAACQPASQAAPTSPPAAATTAPAAAKPTTAPAASPAIAASPSAAAASPVASPSPAIKPAASPAASPAAGTGTQPAAPGATDAGCPNQPAAAGAKQLRVGLVTDVGKINDASFNQSAWEGVQCAQKNLNADVKFIETTDPKDYGKNIDQFAQDNYDVIVSVGFALGDDTISEAKKYTNIKLIGVDQFQADVVPNLAALTFDEDKAGYLAGYLAGSLTKSGTVGQVLGTPLVPPVEKYGRGYINGAKAT